MNIKPGFDGIPTREGIYRWEVLFRDGRDGRQIPKWEILRDCILKSHGANRR